MALFRTRPHFIVCSLRGAPSRLHSSAAASIRGITSLGKKLQPESNRVRNFSCFQSTPPLQLTSPLNARHFTRSLYTTGEYLLAQEKSSKSAAAKRKGRQSGEEHGSVLMQFAGTKKDEPKQLTVGAKVAQAGKDFSWVMVIIGGFAITGFLLWSVGSEFFSGNSPSTIFTKALKRVKNDPQVVEALGEPITGHGDTSGRGRRRDIAHQEYEVDGVTYMRVKFYVDGSKRKATACLDLKKNDQGKFECRFLFVELKGYPPQTIVLEDNR